MSLTNLRDTDKVQLDIDINAFQKMQDAYCESAHVYAACFDTSFHSITRFSGSEEAKKFFGNFITQEMMQTLVASFGDSSIENIISFDTKEPYIFLSGVAIRDDEGSLIGVMLVPCIAKELLAEEDVVFENARMTTFNDYTNSVALMEILMSQYFTTRSREDKLETRLEEKEFPAREV